MINVYKLSQFVFFFFFVYIGQIFAYCETYISESLTEPETITTICASSIVKPFYRITEHYFFNDETTNGYSLIFSFAPRSRKLLCHKIELNGQSNSSCRNFGIDFFPKKFKRNDVTVNMINIDVLINEEINSYFEDGSLFIFPDIPDLVSIEKCFAIVKNDKTIYLGYSEKNIIDLSQCLIKFESFISDFKFSKSYD